MPESVRVIIADDHPIVRKGLCLTIEEDPELKVVAEAADGESALALIDQHRPDIAVLDVDMPKLDGFAVARELRRRKLNTKTVFLTLHTDQDIFREAIDLGVNGYILKDSAMEEIVVGLKAVAAGRPYYSSAVASPLLHKRASGEEHPVDRLTPAERRIMQAIAEGKSSKEIGAELSIHYRTVENHRTNICRKLGIEGASALVRYALQNKGRI